MLLISVSLVVVVAVIVVLASVVYVSSSVVKLKAILLKIETHTFPKKLMTIFKGQNEKFIF